MVNPSPTPALFPSSGSRRVEPLHEALGKRLEEPSLSNLSSPRGKDTDMGIPPVKGSLTARLT